MARSKRVIVNRLERIDLELDVIRTVIQDAAKRTTTTQRIDNEVLKKIDDLKKAVESLRVICKQNYGDISPSFKT